jgi:hypothetical protein
MMKFVGGALIILGTMLLLGTAGASDQGLLTFGDVVTRAMVGLATIGVGIVTTQIANEIQRINKRKERNHEHYHH